MKFSWGATFVVLAVAAAACSTDPAVRVKGATASETTVSASPSASTTVPVDDDPLVPVETVPVDSEPVDSGPVESDVPLPGDPEVVTADGVGDRFYPEMGNGGYDVDNYELRLEVDVATNRLDAVAVITAAATQPLASFNVDLRGLDVARVTVDDVEATFTRADDELTITPAEPVAAGAEFVAEIAYSGEPQPIDDPGVPFDTIGWQNREDTIYVASEPSGAKSWFPSNNHPSDKATFTFEITTDVAMTAVANGVQTDLVVNGQTATTTWVMDDPMTTYLAAIYIGDFELRESTTASGLRIRNYFPPAFADDLEADFELTADVIAFFEELFDAPYPFDEYGSIVVPFSTGFALENQTISLHGLDSTDPITIAHEILHQWMGDSVTVAQWPDIWMLEGFATYLSYMYFEDRGLDGLTPEDMYRIVQSEPTDGPAEVPIEELFGLSVYFRGAMALHALRTEVGDATFVEIVRASYARNVDERISTDEFLAIVNDIAGADAVEVLDPWLFGDVLPPFPS